MPRSLARNLVAAVFLAAFAAPIALVPAAQPARAAEDPAAVLTRMLMLPDMFEIMQAEGAEYGVTLKKEFFDDAVGQDWAGEVAAIYAPDRLMPLFQQAFADDLKATGADPAPLIEFFASPLGQRIVNLELSARRALLDDDIEAASRQRVEEMRAGADPRFTLLEDYVAANHLIDLNVSSALNANMAFFRGLAAAGAFAEGMPEEEMLAQVWSQEDEVRAETETWMLTYVAVAYAPLADDELRAYTQFSMTPEGAALNRALFAGFDAIFSKVSNDLGRAVGRRASGTEL